jgi:threonine/homoserine/homoserine lactone efflux protein
VLSDGPIALLAIVVVGRLPPPAQQVLRASGGLLLLYLALRAFREWREPDTSGNVSAPRTVFEAVLVNVLNPNPYLAWALILGPAVVGAWHANPVYAFGLVGSFYTTMLLTLATFVCLIGTARFLDTRRRYALVGVSAILLAFLGVLLLATAMQDVWIDLAGGES